MPYCVRWEIQGPLEDTETGIKATSIVRDRDFKGAALTLSTLRGIFPYEGTFHFRLRVADPASRASYVWLDLTRDTDDVLAVAQNLGGLEKVGNAEALSLRVLPLSFEPANPATVNDDQDYSSWTEEDLTFGTVVASASPSRYADDSSGRGGAAAEGFGVGKSSEERKRENSDFGAASGHQRRGSDGSGGDASQGGEGHWRGALEQGVKNVISSETAKNIQQKGAQAARLVGSNAKKLWSNFSKGTRASLPTIEALENLHQLSSMLETSLDVKRPEHLALLTRLFEAFFPGAPFEVNSQRWREVGFQSADISADLRGTGTLSLRGLRYMCDKYSAATRTMLEQQAARNASTYPFAVVANNLTLMLADVLELRNQHFSNSRGVFWQMFDDETAYFEVFCVAFRLLDHTWVEQRATRDKFAKIIGHTKSCVESLLDSGPPTLQAFMEQAQAAGLLF